MDNALQAAMEYCAEQEPGLHQYSEVELDQLLQFFENDFVKYSDIIDPERKDQLLSWHSQYLSLLSSVSVQNEMITFHIEELQELITKRTELEQSIRAPAITREYERPLGKITPKLQREQQAKELREVELQIATKKLDVTDCKEKRFFKNKQLAEIRQNLTKEITDLQMNSTKFNNHSDNGTTTDMQTKEDLKPNIGAYQTLRKRHVGKQQRVYSDEEIMKVLKAA